MTNLAMPPAGETEKNIGAAWKSYCDGIYEGDISKLRKVFHPAASLFSLKDASVAALPIEHFLHWLKGTPSPQSTNEQRSEQILSLTVPWADGANMIATILISGRQFTDQLMFVNESGSWRIVAKSYHQHN
jgi:putative lumazine-binding protein